MSSTASAPVDVDRFAREFGTQLIVERIVSQLVDLAAGINTPS